MKVFDVNQDYATAARAHAGRYPRMQAQDFVKLAYQHARGCEHMVRLSPQIAACIDEERRGTGVRFEDIGNGFVRAHLDGGENSVSTELLSRMFAASAQLYRSAEGALENALTALSDLAEGNEFPVSAEEMRAFLGDYRAAGCPAVHHSEIFRAAYAPHYRVLRRVFADYCAVFTALEALKARKPGAVVAIDGMCASGKTTLARAIAAVFDANVYHMDDYFLRPEMRTPQRLAEIGGNVDRERFLSEVLQPLGRGERFTYRPFDCGTMALAAEVASEPAALNVVEGAYSYHPDLIGHYDLIVCLEVEPQLQAARILARNGEAMLARFRNEWIPMENRYLSHFSVADRADFCYRVCGAAAE